MSVPGIGAAQFAFSNDGTFVYVPGNTSGTGNAIFWMDRQGKTQPLRAAPDRYLNIRFSPDGRRLAVQINSKDNDVWVYDWERETMSRLTFDAGLDADPVWTPDGRRIAFGSFRGNQSGGPYGIYWLRADQSGEPQRLTQSQNNQRPRSWHPSGKFLAFQEGAVPRGQGQSPHHHGPAA